MRRNLSLPAVVLALSLALLGCSGDDSDEPENEGGSESTATTETVTEKPEFPAAAKEPTVEGAEAYLTYFVDLINYAAGTGNTKELDKVSMKCGACRTYPTIFENIYQGDGKIEGKLYELGSVEVTEASGDSGNFKGVVVVNGLNSQLTMPDEEEPTDMGDSEYQWTFTLKPAGDSWQLLKLKEKI